MVKKKTLRNLLMASALVSLQACGGGGGGGGAVGVVDNFVNNTVSQLAGSSNIVSQYTSTISDLESYITTLGSVSSLSNVFSAPTQTDISEAQNLLGTINQAELIWKRITGLINSQTNEQKYQIYASEDYKNARAAFLFLTNTVKPIVGKVALGQKITITEFNKVADESTAFDNFQAEKTTTVETEISSLKNEVGGKIKTTEILDPIVEVTYPNSAVFSETATYTDSDETQVTEKGEPVITTSEEDESSTVDNGDGTITTTVTRYTVTKTVTPVTVKTIKTRTYTTPYYYNKNKQTITVPRTKITYVDGSTEIKNGTTNTDTVLVEKVFVRNEQTQETIILSEDTTSSQTTSRNDGVVVSSITSSTAYTDLDPNLGTKTPGYSTTKSDYETNEYEDKDSDGNNQGWANSGKEQVKASDAYSRGWTGKGVTVAVADTGYDMDHSDLVGQVSATKDYTGSGIDDTHGHGTHVLGSIVAKKDGLGTHGVAFDSKAVVIKIGTGTSISQTDAINGFVWAAEQGASVGNISANTNYDTTFRNNLTKLSDGTYTVPAVYDWKGDVVYDYANKVFYGKNTATQDDWKLATQNDFIVVNSAGNQGLAVPANPGYYATAVDNDGNLVLGGKMIIVGAVHQDNTLLTDSNRAGHICQVIVDNSCTDKYKVSDFYILAPGWTYSTKNDGTHGLMQGTSMAAPYVTGGVAIIRQMWPYMKGENVVKLLTTTANKNLPGYTVDTHGAGLMDLEKATRPVGATGIPTTGRTTSSVSTVSLSSSGGSGSSLSALQNSTALSSVMIVDEFARDFYVDLTKGITVQDKRKYSDVQVAQYGAAYLPFQQQYGNYEQGGQFPIFMEGLEFGLYTDKDGNGDWSTNISKKFKLSDKLSIKTTAGTMNEQQTWLGNYTDGALAVGKNNVTNFGQLGVEYVLDNNTFTFDVAQGYTDVKTKSNSLISSVDTLETQSMKLGFERKIDSATKWGITYSIPNRITKGGTNLNVPYATTLNGEVIYDNVRTDLRATTPEKDIGVYFSHNGEGETDWKTSFSIEYRQNVAGVAGDNKIAPSLQVSKKFYGACMKLFGMMNKRPGCEKIRIEKEIKKLSKKKNTEDKIAALRYQLLGVEKQIAHINGDKQTVAKLDKELALGWKQ